MTSPIDHQIRHVDSSPDAAGAVREPAETRRTRAVIKWLLILAVVAALGMLLWFVVFPYLTTLLPENF